MGAALLAVWKDHRHVFQRGHYSFVRFAGETLCELEDAILMMKGQWEVVAVRGDADLTDKLLARAGE